MCDCGGDGGGVVCVWMGRRSRQAVRQGRVGQEGVLWLGKKG